MVLKIKIQSSNGVGDDGNDNDADDDGDDDDDDGDDDDDDGTDNDDDDGKPLEVGHQVSHYQRSELSLRFSRQLVAP